MAGDGSYVARPAGEGPRCKEDATRKSKAPITRRGALSLVGDGFDMQQWPKHVPAQPTWPRGSGCLRFPRRGMDHCRGRKVRIYDAVTTTTFSSNRRWFRCSKAKNRSFSLPERGFAWPPLRQWTAGNPVCTRSKVHLKHGPFIPVVPTQGKCRAAGCWHRERSVESRMAIPKAD